VLVVSGGLGPTTDDLTKEAFAALLDDELVLDEATLEEIRQRFARRGLPMSEANRKQAMLPRGARKIPNPLARRHLIEKDLDAASALAIAETYIEDGRAVEALDFFAKAAARDRLAAVRDEAVERGDAFLFQAACRHLGEAPVAERWQRLAEVAEAAGKDAYAATARRQAGHTQE